MSTIAFLEELEQTIRRRLREAPDGSYSAGLASKGIVAVAQKVGEEGVELALAAVAEGNEKIVAEAADLLYHMLLLLGVKDVPLARVVEALEERHRARSAPR
jgi:phosphoribosyl-ATP pyrophosphohydrolase/phosphoribosyl-AMP cyclohydrolase